MSRFLLISLCSAAVLSAHAASAPLTTNEIGLMIRTGYSSKTILEELAKRRYADSLDATAESQLLRSGASPDLVLALKNGQYMVSADELAAAQRQKEAEAKRRAAAIEESKKSNTLHQARLAESRAAAAAAMPQQLNRGIVYQQLKGDLVQFHNGAVNRFDDTGLESKKYFLLYFSAHWCGPCRKFTPGLVNYYNDSIAKHPEVEVIFFSADKSPFGMETYMKEMNMPWPAIDFQKRLEKAGIQKYAGKGIPDLVLLDSSGNVLADSYRGEEYLGPESVMQALDTLLNKRQSVAQAP